MKTEILPGFEFKKEIRELFEEYTRMLIENDPVFAQYLVIQNYEKEINDLTVKYGPPKGRLYIAFTDGKPSGCIGLKSFGENGCEMKRLYVRPEYRGMGLGRALASKVIGEAKKEGYTHMLLDTLPFLTDAQRMYRSMGFYEIPPYLESPMTDAIYLRLDL